MAAKKSKPVSEPAPYTSPTAGITARREFGRNAWRFETLNYLWWFEPGGETDLSVADRVPPDEEPEWHDLVRCGDLEYAIQWAAGYERGACNPKRDVGADLENALEAGLDDVLYRLTQILVNQRNDEDEAVKKGGGNPAQAAYLQRCVELMNDCQSRVEKL